MVETAAPTRRLLRAGNIQSTTIVLTALLPPEVRGRRERLGEALLRPVGEEDLRAPSLALVHDARVLELLNESFLAPAAACKQSRISDKTGRCLLIVGVAHLQDLLARVHVPNTQPLAIASSR